MISIYSQDNTEYTKNGDAVLIPTRCELSLTINGAWQLTLEHPYDQEERYKYIVEGAVVQCDIKCIRELPVVKQRFRIYTYTKGLHGITAIGFPIAMESTYDAPIDNLVISGKTGAQAMALIQTFTNKYTLSTDVTKTASASMSNTNVNSAIASGNANSFIGAWGGEILYSNYDFMVKNRLGDNVAGDHRIIYGRNLTDIEYKKDDSGLTTRIYPISEDGIRLNGTGYVDSPKISDYPIIHHRFMQAPYKLIDTDASSATAIAQQTRTSLAAISAAATTLSQGVDISSYPPEYIKQQRADIVAAVQTMALNGVISTSLYNAAAKTIADAMAWMNNLAQPEWDWMGSYEAGWKYGNSDGYAVSQYVKIGKTWRYFGANGNWQEPADSSNEWDWFQNTEETGKKYGDFSRYYAHNEYVFITLSGQLKQYWFNEEGWYEKDESGDSDYGWNGTGTAEDPYWFGESKTKYLKSCWAFIDGKYYFFDEYGYYDGSTKFDDYQWDWVDDGSRAWFGNPDHEFAAYYLKNQWCKIDGSWYYFDANGYVYDDNAAKANVISLYTTGMAALATTVSTQATALYTLLYSLMTSYAQSKFNSGVDMPYITITVNMADLSKTTEYAGYENLETVKLGDSVECIDNEHDISMTNRVIGLTYDVIRDYNSEVVLGNAAATVASIVGNASGQAVAGGFDTSAIEAQLDSLQDKIGEVLMNGASIVTNGVASFNLQAGENISISRDGRTLTISGEGGGNTVYAGTSTPSASIGAEDDLYLQLGVKTEDILSEDRFTPNSTAQYPFTMSNFTKTARNEFSFDFAGKPSTMGAGETGTFDLDGLVVGNTYTVEFDLKFNDGATWMSGDNLRDYLTVCGQSVIFQTNSNNNHYQLTFTYTENGTAVFRFYKIKDYVNFTATITNFTITGNFYDGIEEIYGKISGKWEKYEGGETYTDFVGTDGTSDGASGLVPAPTSADVDKVLKSDGTWGDAAAVEANPSGTATDTLTKLGIDGTVYEIQGGGGGAGGSSVYSEKQLYKASVDSFQNISVTWDWEEYDAYIFSVHDTCLTTSHNQNGDSTILTKAQIKNLIDTELKQVMYRGLGYIIYVFSDSTITAKSNSRGFFITKIIGLKFGTLSPIIYSTEEREVGVWTDNKPLYQKTISVKATTSPQYMDISSLNVENVPYINGKATDDTGTNDLPLPYYDSANWWAILSTDKQNNRVLIATSSNFRNSYPNITFTLQYTKTTDTAGSGSYNTLGVPNVHYDGNEKVIGTWFGETLYEKIINFDYNNIQSRTSSGCEIYINVPNIKDTKESVILFKGGIIQFPYFVSTSIFIGGFTQTETDTFHISLRYSSSVYSELNAYLIDCRVKLQYTKTTD